MVQGSGHYTRVRTTRFYKDHFVVESEAGKKTRSQYADVEKISESRHLWVLRCKGKAEMLLKKDGFDAGDMDTVKIWWGKFDKISRICLK
mgnify:CR=1 FL=1